MTAQEIDDFSERGRVFYEMFPGTAASDEWRRHSALVESVPAAERDPADGRVAVKTGSTETANSSR